MPKRIVMTPWGSLGDLHPYLALAIELQRRGYEVVIATSEVYRRKVELEGLRFHAVRPDVGRLVEDQAALARAYDFKTGSEYVIRELVLPYLEETYTDLARICHKADLIVSHVLAYTVPLLAEQHAKPWVSVALQPMIFLSTYDPPLFAKAPGLLKLREWGRLPYALAFRLGSLPVRKWAEPVLELRGRLGLPPAKANPLLEGTFSPHGTLVCYSPLLGGPQPDWPPRTRVTGFAFYDKLEPGVGMEPGLAEFLEAGDPPVIFTLGSSAVMQAGDFFRESCAAICRLGCRAVLLVGRDPRNRPAVPLPNVFVAEYAPYSQLLPRGAITVHQAGIGTTAQALAAGRPMLLVPYSHDQPDNARRVARLGVARVIPRQAYTADGAAAELRQILEDGAYARRAQEVGREIRKEGGAAAACDALEEVMRTGHIS